MSYAQLVAAWSLAFTPGLSSPHLGVSSLTSTAPRSRRAVCTVDIFPGDELDEIGRKFLPPKPTWVEGALDNGDAYWWRDVPGSNEPEIRLTNPSASPGAPVADVRSTSPEWNQGVLDSGDPYWWRDSDVEDDGIEISLSEPGAADASE